MEVAHDMVAIFTSHGGSDSTRDDTHVGERVLSIEYI